MQNVWETQVKLVNSEVNSATFIGKQLLSFWGKTLIIFTLKSPFSNFISDLFLLFDVSAR